MLAWGKQVRTLFWVAIISIGVVLGFTVTSLFLNYQSEATKRAKANRTAIDFVTRMDAGEKLKAVLNSCPQDDESWEGKNDPLGTVKCGETYELRYIPSTQKWSVKGFHEGRNKIVMLESGGPAPRERAFSIWGGIYFFDGSGQIYKRNRLGKVSRWGYLDY